MPHGREWVNIISLKHDADKSNMLNTNYILKIPKLKTGWKENKNSIENSKRDFTSSYAIYDSWHLLHKIVSDKRRWCNEISIVYSF